MDATRAEQAKARDERRMQVLDVIKGGLSQMAAARRLGIPVYHVRDDVTWLRKEGLLAPPPRPALLTKRAPDPPSLPVVPGYTIAQVQRLTVCIIHCPKCHAPIQVSADKLR